ncbi:caspase, EACC1-associated type [Solihabitans fulvus]|uniref:caspase, EACC1-associated type n=1 Tax=Solihabitans fulvus TaxID=1892852 RepID=UPI001661D0C5|nr:caspase family protein [Solihabitans fulvus]
MATDEYQDGTLRTLAAPHHDATALAEVLCDPAVGGYRTSVLRNASASRVTREIESVFTKARHDDVLLLYFSGHGIKDDAGQLYLATTDTEHGLPRSTTVPAQFVRDQIDRSYSRRTMVVLDCCFGGAFPRSHVHRAGEEVPVQEFLSGRGSVILTASTALEYAYEIDGVAITGGSTRSVFTEVLVEGLRTGDADLDGDGLVDVDELYRYVYHQVRDRNPKQTPKFDCTFAGPLIIARSPKGPRLGVGLPREVVDALRSPLSAVRHAALGYLIEFVDGEDPLLAGSARRALDQLTADPDSQVARAARSAIASPGQPVSNQASASARHHETVELAVQEAAQREQLNHLFVNFSRRSQSLVERQLGVIDRLKQEERDPDHLASLFKLDHLATRMRRYSENLLILSGHHLGPESPNPVPVVDVVRAAVSEIEQYSRVSWTTAPALLVAGSAARDLVHLLAELIDNATAYSSPETMVTVTVVEAADGRLVIRVRDRGVGMTDRDLDEANRRFADPPAIYPGGEVIHRTGMFVVARLATRHRIAVRLSDGDGGDGVDALVAVPADLVRPAS